MKLSPQNVVSWLNVIRLRAKESPEAQGAELRQGCQALKEEANTGRVEAVEPARAPSHLQLVGQLA